MALQPRIQVLHKLLAVCTVPGILVGGNGGSEPDGANLGAFVQDEAEAPFVTVAITLASVDDKLVANDDDPATAYLTVPRETL